MVSDALARDGVEIPLNSIATKVWMEGGQKVVELVNDGNTATTRVDHILTGIGRVPAVHGLNLEAAGVAWSAEAGVHVDDFLRTVREGSPSAAHSRQDLHDPDARCRPRHH